MASWPILSVVTFLPLVGALFIMLALLLTFAQLFYSFRTRDQRRDVTGDPWDGRSLEWATASPFPRHNFTSIPRVRSESPAFDLNHPEFAAPEAKAESKKG